MYTQRITLSVGEYPSIEVGAVQNDTMSRYLDITLMGDGTPIDLTGCLAQFVALKPDGHTIFNDAEIIDPTKGLVRAKLTLQTLLIVGAVKAEITVSKNGARLTSFPFNIRVVRSLLNEESIESSDEFDALSKYFDELKKTNELINAEESVRQNNETIRVNNEIVRSTNEDKRKANELERISNETKRETEWGKLKTDSEKVLKDTTEKLAEVQATEADIKSSEAIRVKNENDRISKESERVTAEANRETQEDKRKSNEATRENNEEIRVADENKRITMELDRKSHEEDRVSAESKRVTAETSREEAETLRKEGYTKMEDTITQFSVCEPYDNGKQYKKFNRVTFGGSTYECTEDAIGVPPTETTHWIEIARKGLDGSGAGDMLKSVYDKDNNGIVDTASEALSVEWAGIKNVPEFTDYMKKSTYDVNGNGIVDMAEEAKSIDWGNIKNIPDLSTAERKTYTELKALKDGGKLGVGKTYILTDYRTKYKQPGTDVIKTMEVEELVLTASSSNTFYPVVFSPKYPQDVIWYDFNNNKCEDSSTPRNGFILRRYDTIIGSDCPQDWRTMLWARWKPDAYQYYQNDVLTNYSVWTGGYASTGSIYKTGNTLCIAKTSRIPSSPTDSEVFEVIYADITVGTLLEDKEEVFNYSQYKLALKKGGLHERLTFGYSSSLNIVGYTSLLHNNVFGSTCVENVLSPGCTSNTFGNSCRNNTLGNHCNHNKIGNGCTYNVLGDDARRITLDQFCGYNSIGVGCVNIYVGFGSYSNSFGRCNDVNIGARQEGLRVLNLHGKSFYFLESQKLKCPVTIDQKSDGTYAYSYLSESNTIRYTNIP